MNVRLQKVLSGISLRNGLGIGGRRAASRVDIPVIFEPDPPRGGLVMVFSAIGGVVMFAMEPAASIALLFATFGIAVHTTNQPGVRMWDLYQRALSRPLDERIALLREARDLAPQNGQVTYALALSLLAARAYTEAAEVLRSLDQLHPNHSAVESALLAANRMLLAQASLPR